MPELPDVEIFRQYLQSTALHRTIEKVRVEAPEMLGDVSASRLQERLAGNALGAVRRHGKYLFAAADSAGWLVLHFGMTGYLKAYRDPESAPGHERLVLDLADGYHLAYACPRKLGRIDWCRTPEEFRKQEGLGPDPFGEGFGRAAFDELLAGRRGSIKGLLMNQQAVAGIGNIYSDEILFQTGIHPRTRAADLRERGGGLFDGMMAVLETAVACRVGERGWPEGWLLPRREPGAACPRCGGRIERIRVVGRNAYVCSRHQSG